MKSLVLLVAAALAGTVSAGTPQPDGRVSTLVRKLKDSSEHPQMMVFAHRTCWWGAAPENSLAGIRNCIGTGIDGIEIDVVKTKDGKLVVLHDLTVDRTTNGIGKVADLTLAQVKALRLKAEAGGPDAALTNEQVPTLEEVLRLAKPHFIVHVHNKEADREQDIAKVVDRLGMKDQVTMWYDSRLDSTEGATSPLSGHVQLISTINECGSPYKPCRSLPAGDMTAFARFHPVALNVNFVTHEFLRQVVNAPRPPFRIATNTLGALDVGPLDKLEAEWGAQMELGASLILTNRPKELVEFARKREAGRAPPGDRRP